MRPSALRLSARRVLGALVLVAALPLAMTACGGDGSTSGDTIVIGTKFDQPGLGQKNPDGSMSGFDVDVARYVAKELGYPEDKIEWKESPSAQRETLIDNDQVKFIVATYSITDARKQKVDFAGPYLLTGQSLLVKSDNTAINGAESLQDNKKLCSVSGSTPAQRIKDKYPGVNLLELGDNLYLFSEQVPEVNGRWLVAGRSVTWPTLDDPNIFQQELTLEPYNPRTVDPFA